MDPLRQNIWLLVVVGMIFVSVVISLIFILINICISRKGKKRFVPLQKRPDSRLKSNTYKERTLNVSTPPLPPRTQFLLAEAQSYENLAEAPEDEESLGNYEECVDPPPGSPVNDGTELYCQPDPKTESAPAAGESYENLTEEHDYEESIDYVKVDDEPETLPAPPSHNPADMRLQSQFFNPIEDNDYEESTDQLDYVKVDDELETFPAPPSHNPADLKLQPQFSLGQSYENLTEEPDYEEITDDQLDYVKVEDEENPFAHPPDPAAEDSSSEDYDDIGETSDDKDEDDYDDLA
ncbi:hypothetical protein OJAV_G00143660 [Oryzias javanicus]|uniref:Uncharacterized protein n=1 Tax=Oryzias javanicus TaxID=123683 RepID=A0A437CMX1_ORYJA|nr:hypothetical protein OJAV_G00143660 [Oryzias javanicus]